MGEVDMILALVAGLVLATADGAPTPATDWTRKPDDFAPYYPDRAQREGVSGRVVVDCLTTSDHHLVDCRVVSEEPANYGFGDTAVKMASKFVVKPNVPGGAHLKFPIRFAPPSDPAPPAVPNPPTTPWRFSGPRE